MEISDAEKNDMCERVLEIVAQKFDIARDKLRLSSEYCDPNGLDAAGLDQADLVAALEREFHVTIHDDSEGRVLTIGDSIKWIAELRGISGMDQYIDERELRELGAAKYAQLQSARRKARVWQREYRSAGFFKKLIMDWEEFRKF